MVWILIKFMKNSWVQEDENAICNRLHLVSYIMQLLPSKPVIISVNYKFIGTMMIQTKKSDSSWIILLSCLFVCFLWVSLTVHSHVEKLSWNQQPNWIFEILCKRSKRILLWRSRISLRIWHWWFSDDGCGRSVFYWL